MSALAVCALYALVVVLCLHNFVDCARTPASRVRLLPKAVWLVLMFVAPVLGGLAWLYLGKRRRPAPQRAQNGSGAQTFAQV
ncbi:PLDc N-terminal domain-containing protein [Streptomyces sp. CA-249302]|uniref:PLDc N-terminal domain-containing protein n=1 Tax=Streptomyces sp. CA-249302 TaxID=3240058 RepID=UPI003D92DE3E